MDMHLERIKSKQIKNENRNGEEIHHFPNSRRFPKNFGEWVLTTTKGKTIQTSNLEELEEYPGMIVTNTHHEYGYKFNKLQDRWMVWDFEFNRNIT